MLYSKPMRVRNFVAASCLIASLVSQPLFVFAQTASSIASIDAGFDPNYILDDNDIFDLQGMTRDKIQKFLESKGSLGDYRTKDIDGIEKPASDIIWRVSTSYKLNPKYLMALMQKEQSLVEGPPPSQRALDWATGFAVCDSCSKDDPAIQAYKGFANQLEYAAKQHRERYLFQILGKGATISGYAPGKTVTVDGQKVTPVNNTTAMLYTYTPHLHGNLNLWRIWQRWYAMNFTDGTIVKAKTSGKTYLIRGDEKRLFKSKAVIASMVDPEKILSVEDSQLSSYMDGKTISFPNYSIVETEKNTLYLINGEQKRLIVSKKVFTKLGFTEDDIVEGTNADLTAYTDGPDITSSTTNPTGLLAKDPDGNLWFIEDGIRHSIPNRAFLKLYFNNRPTKSLTKKQLDQNKLGDPIRLHDGELVKSSTKGKNSVYVVENGALRPIPSGEIFESLGWQWKNVISLPDSVLKDYIIGDSVELYRRPATVTPEDDLPDDAPVTQVSQTTSTTQIASN